MSLSKYKEILKTARINGLNIDKKHNNGDCINYFENNDFFNYFAHHISHKLFHINYKKNYFSHNLKGTKFKNFEIYSKIYNKISLIITNLCKFFFKRKKKQNQLFETEVLFFTNHRVSNENNIFPITNVIEKKKFQYSVIFETDDPEKINDYLKIYNEDKLINIDRNFVIFDFLKSIIFPLINIRKIFLIKNHIKKISLLNLLIDCSKCYYLYLNYKEIIRKINPKKIFLNYSSGKEFFIFAAKEFNNKITVFGYALHGISYSNQCLTSHYLFNHIDKLFVYGKLDYKHFNHLKKHNTIFSLPKEIIISGSVRDSLIASKKKQNISREKNLLYIKSNPNMLNDIDGKFSQLFYKICKQNNFKKLNIKLKERNLIANSTKILIKNKILLNKDLITNNSLKTEDLIFSNDFILGTYSTSFIYQSIFQEKVIIQFGSDEIFWANLNKLGFCTANSEDEIKKILIGISSDNFSYEHYLKKQSILKKYLISIDRNPLDIIIENIYR